MATAADGGVVEVGGAAAQVVGSDWEMAASAGGQVAAAATAHLGQANDDMGWGGDAQATSDWAADPAAPATQAPAASGWD